MLDVGRRGFFGLLAAPAIISITGRLQPALLVPFSTDKLVVGTLNSDIDPVLASYRGPGWMNYHRFREIVEPILREHFEEAFKDNFDAAFRVEADAVERRLRRENKLIHPDFKDRLQRDVETYRRRLERRAR